MRGIGTINVTQEPRAEPLSLAEAKAHLRATDNSEDVLIASLITTARNAVEAYLQRALVLQTVELAFDCFYDVFRLDRLPLMKFGGVQYRDSAGTLQTLSTSIYQVDTRSEPGRLTRAYAQVWPQIRGGEDLHSVLVTYQCGYLAPFTANLNTDVLTVQDNPFADGDKVYVSQSGGAVPAPLAVDTPYYVRDTAGATLKLAATAGGAAIDLSDAGTGSLFLSRRKYPAAITAGMKLLLGHLFENREETISGTIIAKLPLGSRALLNPYRMPGFA